MSPSSLLTALRSGVVLVLLTTAAAGQAVQPEPGAVPAGDAQMAHQHEPAAAPSAWRFMYDGVLFGTYIDQGGVRGSRSFRSQNWFMGMGSRSLGRSTLTLMGMVTLEPATTGQDGGYAEIFQVGETYNNLPLVDRQHPHDFLMQLAAIWRVPFGNRSALTLFVAPVGEATVGPVAFMHRLSAVENPTAPLGHHTFDSTHVAMEVVGAGLEFGPFMLEGSGFRGREPDENRWDLMDPGKIDSIAGRLWFRPGRWEFQVSSAFLTRPEPLESQDIRRSTASVSWSREGRSGFTAFTAAAGLNERPYSQSAAFLGEITHRFGMNTIYARAEHVEVETEHLLFPGFVHVPHPGELIDPVQSFTIGGVRDLPKFHGIELGLGGDVQFYNVPFNLRETHGDRPVSFHLFFRLRPPVSKMGRMTNAVMSQPMRGHAHAGMK